MGTNPQDVIDYIQRNIDNIKHKHNNVGIRTLCSALAYKKTLSNKNIQKLVSEILTEEEYLGLLEQTNEFEYFNCINLCCVHSCLHDTCGRVFSKYEVDSVYCYAISDDLTSNFMKGSCFLGHITGGFTV